MKNDNIQFREWLVELIFKQSKNLCQIPYRTKYLSIFANF